MKKLISLALVLALMLTLGVSAFADIYGEDAQGNDIETSPVNGDAKWVLVSGDNLEITGKVTGHDEVSNSSSVYASTGANVTVGDSVTESQGGHGINASGNNTEVTVGGDVTESGDGKAINATNGAKVTVEGNVTESGADSAISAESGAQVRVEGNVTENDNGFAIAANDATIIVVGNVCGNDYGVGIDAKYGAKVMIGGDLEGSSTPSIQTGGDNNLVIVEGSVNNGFNYGTIKGNDQFYVGELVNAPTSGYQNIHYLIGVAPEGSAPLSDVNVVGTYVAEGTIDGVKGSYKYTTTAEAALLAGEEITLTPVEGKILTSVSGFNTEDIGYVIAADGSNAVLTLMTDVFKGGLQNLVLVLADKPGPGPDPAPDPAPVYYVVYVPDYLVSAADVTLPEGLTEADVSLYNRDSHSGITLSASLLSGNARDSVKVFIGSEELPSGNYSFLPHKDGSVSVILSNTYLLSLGSGSYDFTVAVGGLEIPFTVTVAK